MGLFGKKKEAVKTAAPQPSTGPKETTYFGKNLKVKGNVFGSGDLIILGSLEGEFNLAGKLQIAEPSNISGTVKAGDISVKGNVQGTITAAERVHLDKTARVQGRINSPKISVTEGARFDGDINMSGKKPQPVPSASAETPAATNNPDIPKKE
jgi:cytoskeletal protein CcmA (bactofilin family)